MVADIITSGGIGRKAERLAVPVSQTIIRDIHGNPIVVAFLVGNAIVVSRTGDKDFTAVLARLGEEPPTVQRMGK